MSVSKFQYRALPDGHIRLLKIRQPHVTQPGPLHLELYTFAPDTSPAYKALSYVWGQPSTEDRYRLMCHDMTAGEAFVLPDQADVGWMQLTPNLHGALPYILEQWDGYIWIDAICINQRDEVEKARIVARMHAYFSQAMEVLIWYGSAADGSDRVIQLLKDIYSHVESTGNDRRRSKSDLVEQITGRTDQIEHSRDSSSVSSAIFQYLWNRNRGPRNEYRLPHESDPIWADFRALCSRDWMRRVWTFQEAVLAQKATVVCGSSIIAYTTFERVIYRWIGEESLVWKGTNYLDLHAPVTDEFKALDSHRLATLLCLGEGELDGKRQLDWSLFFQVLNAMRTRHCALDEDRIYGVLALTKESIRGKIPIRYSKYADAVSHLYMQINSLYLELEADRLFEILSVAAGQDARHDMPSWCADWRQPWKMWFHSSPVEIPPGLLGSFAWRDHTPDGVQNARILRIRGIEVSRVRSVFHRWTDHHEFMRWIREEATSRGSTDDDELIELLCGEVLNILAASWDDIIGAWARYRDVGDSLRSEICDFPRGIAERLLPYALVRLSAGGLKVTFNSSQVGDMAVVFCSKPYVCVLRPEQDLDEYGNSYVSYVGMLWSEERWDAVWATEPEIQLIAQSGENFDKYASTLESRLRIFSII